MTSLVCPRLKEVMQLPFSHTINAYLMVLNPHTEMSASGVCENMVDTILTHSWHVVYLVH